MIAVGAASQGPTERPALIGRALEIERLRGALGDAGGGRGSVWLVTGEPGIGKSRLVEVFDDHARTIGIEVFWGRCWEAGGAPAYWPWIQVLRSILGENVRADPVLEHLAPVLRQILPEVAGQDEQAAHDNLEPDEARFQLMDAVAQVLQAAAADGPRVIVLEDLHAADPASVMLLDFMARLVTTVPLVIVATYREIMADSDPTARIIAGVARQARGILRPGRMNVDEVAACIEHVTGSTVAPQVVSAGVDRYFLHVDPVATPDELPEWLESEGLRPYHRAWAKFARGVEPAPSVDSELRVQEIGADHASDFGGIAASGFGLDRAWNPVIAGLVGQPGWHVYLSFDGDRPAGSGAMRIHDGAAWLDWAATLPEFRRRGSQGALLARRIADGLRMGVDLFVTSTGEAVEGDPQHSYRNIERSGFRRTHSRANWVPSGGRERG